MKGIMKGSVVALSIIIAALALTFLFIPFQKPSLNSKAEDLMPATSNPRFREILLVANEQSIKVAPDNSLYPGGLLYQAMTFNGTIPGPLIVANQGDTLGITLQNQGSLVHSLNFHAGFGPSQALSGVVEPGKTKRWTMKPDHPGSFLYHCDGDNLNGIWEHIADGMYGGIVVRPSGEKATKNEFYVAFSELYTTNITSTFGAGSYPSTSSQMEGSFDMNKFMAQRPDLILTNGMAFRYIPFIGTKAKIPLNGNAETFHVKAGEPTRWYLFNAGPRDSIAFNFGAALIKEISFGDNGTATSNGIPSPDSANNRFDEVVSIPPGSGTIIEVTFPEAGLYFGNDHDVGSLLMGAGFVVIAE